MITITLTPLVIGVFIFLLLIFCSLAVFVFRNAKGIANTLYEKYQLENQLEKKQVMCDKLILEIKEKDSLINNFKVMEKYLNNLEQQMKEKQP